MTYLVADIGGTRIKAGVFSNNTLSISKSVDIDSQKSFQEAIIKLDYLFSDLIHSQNLSKKDIHAIGLGLPGIVDVDRNKVIAINEKYRDAVNFEFNDWAQNNWNVKVVTDNDARAALLGISKYGIGKDYENIVTMTLGTGVGGAALINGKLLYGKHYQAGCLGGHFTVDLNGYLCNCGNLGCVEAMGSSWNLEKIVKDHPSIDASPLKNEKKIEFKVLFNYYRKNETVSVDVIKNIMRAWSAGAVNLIHAYDPEVIVLSGGVLKSADIIVPYMQNWINKYAWTPWGKVEVKVAESIEDAALYGMAYLAGRKISNEN